MGSPVCTLKPSCTNLTQDDVRGAALAAMQPVAAVLIGQQPEGGDASISVLREALRAVEGAQGVTGTLAERRSAWMAWAQATITGAEALSRP